MTDSFCKTRKVSAYVLLLYRFLVFGPFWFFQVFCSKTDIKPKPSIVEGRGGQ
jgi:hypothetical protein